MTTGLENWTKNGLFPHTRRQIQWTLGEYAEEIVQTRTLMNKLAYRERKGKGNKYKRKHGQVKNKKGEVMETKSMNAQQQKLDNKPDYIKKAAKLMNNEMYWRALTLPKKWLRPTTGSGSATENEEEETKFFSFLCKAVDDPLRNKRSIPLDGKPTGSKVTAAKVLLCMHTYNMSVKKLNVQHGILYFVLDYFHRRMLSKEEVLLGLVTQRKAYEFGSYLKGFEKWLSAHRTTRINVFKYGLVHDAEVLSLEDGTEGGSPKKSSPKKSKSKADASSSAEEEKANKEKANNTPAGGNGGVGFGRGGENTRRAPASKNVASMASQAAASRPVKTGPTKAKDLLENFDTKPLQNTKKNIEKLFLSPTAKFRSLDTSVAFRKLIINEAYIA